MTFVWVYTKHMRIKLCKATLPHYNAVCPSVKQLKLLYSPHCNYDNISMNCAARSPTVEQSNSSVTQYRNTFTSRCQDSTYLSTFTPLHTTSVGCERSLKQINSQEQRELNIAFAFYVFFLRDRKSFGR